MVDITDFEDEPNSELFYLVGSFRDLIISDNGFNLLISNINDIPQKFEALLASLKRIYLKDKKQIEDFNQEMAELTKDFIEYLEQNKTWFTAYLQGRVSEEARSYFLNDPFYKNKVSYHALTGVKDHYFHIYNFRRRAIRSYRALSKTLGLKNGLALDPKVFQLLEGSFNDSSKNATIWIEDEQLLYKEDEGPTAEIIPLSNYSFITSFDNYFNTLVFDENNEVAGIKYHFFDDIGYLKKVGGNN